MKEFTQRIKLIPFLNARLKSLNVYTDSDSRLLSNIRDILTGRTIVPVSNSNSHSYRLGIPIVMPPDVRVGHIDRYFGFDFSAVNDISFERLIPGGNHIRAIDIEIEVMVSLEQYIESLKILKDTVEAEIDFVTKTASLSEKEGDKRQVFELFREVIMTPSNKIDLSLLDKLCKTLKADPSIQSSKKELYV